MIKFITKKEDNQIGIFLVIDTSTAKQKMADFQNNFRSFEQKAAKNISWRMNILKTVFRALFSKPGVVSLKSKDGYSSVFMKWEEKAESSVEPKVIRPESRSDLLGSTFAKVKPDRSDLVQEPLKIEKKHLVKGIASLGIIALIAQTFLPGSFLSFAPLASADGMCSVDVDVVLVMDISGSMANGEAPSKCEWSEMMPYGNGSTWFLNVKYDVSEDWCNDVRDSFDESDPVFHFVPLSYTQASNSKITDAKNSANTFIDNLEANDQSALVSFSTNATLEKQLSNDHNQTRTVLNALTVGGATNIGDAIKKATDELSSVRANPQANKTIILLTDGKANKPNGDGLNENQDDVDYAEERAYAAYDNYNIKVFTIGLGSNSDINETMLENIANYTGARYYYASNGTDLSTIYDDIAWEICQYGSISGCKYNDLNNNGAIDQGEPLLDDWKIILAGGPNGTTTQMTVDGCYKFAGLEDGQYFVSETIQQGWIQTAPVGSHSVAISNHNDVEDRDFLNYYPEPANGQISGHKYDYDTQTGLSGWVIQLFDSATSSTPYATATTDVNGSYSFNDLAAGTYVVSEVQQVGWNQILPDTPDYWQFDLGQDESTTTIDFYNQEITGFLPACSDGIDNDDDGLIDFPDDPGCEDAQDNDETDPTPVPVCGNGILEAGEECDDGNTDNGDGCSCSCTLEVDIIPGDVVINEIMKNPFFNADTYGEWFELYNTTDNPIDINNCIISDLGFDSHTIGASTVIQPHDYALLGRSDDPVLNGGIVPDYIYSGFGLSNADDEIILTCDNVEIDRVEYDNGVNWPDPEGKSMVLANPLLDNNDGANWCESTSPYGDGDKGTPGEDNDVCPNVCAGSIEGSKRDYLTDEGLTGWDINLEMFVVNNWVLIATTTTDCSGHYIFTGLCQDDYRVNEVLQPGWEQKSPSSPDYWEFGLADNNSATTTIDFINYYPECGNGILDAGEECDDGNLTDGDGCSCNCLDEEEEEEENGDGDGGNGGGDGAGGGGGGGIPALIIFSEQNLEVLTDEVTVSWFTNRLADSRVVYDTVSHPDSELGPAPNYGYAYSTDTDGNKVTFHEMVLRGLNPEFEYFWRAISAASPEVLGDEMSFMTASEGTGGEEGGGEAGEGGAGEGEGAEESAGEGEGGEGTGEGTGEGEGAEEGAGGEEGTGGEEEGEGEGEEEEKPEEEVISEEMGRTGLANLLAAVSNFDNLKHLCWILALAAILLSLLYLFTRKRINQERIRYDWDLIILLIILFIFLFILKCYLLIIPIIILLIPWIKYLLVGKKTDQGEQEPK